MIAATAPQCAGEIFHFRRRRAGVGGHRNGAEFDAGKPGQHGLDAIVEMDQDILAGLDAARGKARRPARRPARETRRSSRPAPAPRTAPRSETDGRAASRPASAAATARPARRMARRCPALPVNSTWILPRSLAGCFVVIAWEQFCHWMARRRKSRPRHPGLAAFASLQDVARAADSLGSRAGPQHDGVRFKLRPSSYDEISIKLPSGSRQ